MNPLNQTDVANLRESIRATVTHLSGKTVPEAETALQRHLEFLLTQERELFTAGVVVQKPDTDTPGAPWYPDTDTSGAPWYPDTDTSGAPWYPDDSGKWVEVPPGTRALPPELVDPKCLSEVLSSTERRTKTYFGRTYPAEGWPWHGAHGGSTVAYKIVD